MEEKILEFGMNNGYKASTIILLAILLLVFVNTDKVLLLKSEIYNFFAKTSSFAKKKQISNKVRGTILRSVKEQSLTDNNVIPSDMKVVWVNEEKAEAFVENNQVIVRIKQSSNPHENLVMAVSEYVNNGLLYNVKRYLNHEVMDASRILMIRKIIQVSDKSSLAYLDENYISPKFKAEPDLQELYNDLLKIDNNGMFIGILLNEFRKAGLSIHGYIEDPLLFAESKEFMRFLYDIANRTSSDQTNLCFNREYFKVSIFLTASNYTIKKSGITPFINAAHKQLNDGIKTIYIFGLGTKREVAEKISKELDSDLRIGKNIKHTYKHIGHIDGKRIPGVFYECEIYKDEIQEDTN